MACTRRSTFSNKQSTKLRKSKKQEQQPSKGVKPELLIEHWQSHRSSSEINNEIMKLKRKGR